MKIGQELSDLAQELERQRVTKRDFIAPSKLVSMNVNGDISLQIGDQGNFEIRETAHQQIAQRLGIPQKYYEKCLKEDTKLLSENVNAWLQKDQDKRMVRTLDGQARAFLSSRYRPLDNFDLAEIVLPVLTESGCRIESSALTEKRFYIKAITERINLEVSKGDVVQAGIVISNSEIGLGSVKVEPLIFRLVCLNGMISQDSSLIKYHVGKDSESDLAELFFRDETRKADDRAFWMKVKDVVRGSFRQDVFSVIVDKMRLASARVIEADVVDVVESIKDKFILSDQERGGVLSYLIKGGDLTQYGLVNAVTRASQDVEDYDRATELERIGGSVLELTKQEWEQITN